MLKEILIKGINVKEPKTFSKDGRSWQAWPVGIVVTNNNGEDEWVNGLVNSHPQWQKGDTVTLEIWKDEKWGWKFKVPKQDDLISQRMDSLELRVARLEGKNDAQSISSAQSNTEQSVVSQNKVSQTAQPGDPNYINPEDIPF